MTPEISDLVKRRLSMGLTFIFLTIACTVLGQLLLKLGVVEVGAAGRADVPLIARALTNIKVVSGLACAVAAALCWIVAVSRSNLSFAYPFMGLAIVLVLALSPTLLGEPVSLKRWIGVGIVCLGLWIAAQE